MKTTLKRFVALVASVVVCTGTALLIGSRHVEKVSAAAAPAPVVETVLINCLAQGGGGVNVYAFEKSTGAPAPSSTTSCAQILSEYVNQGFKIQSENLDALTSGLTFHLAR